jgi:hypothetical protein
MSWSLRGVCLQFFLIFFISFREIKNWMVPKARSWKHLSMSFSASRFRDHLDLPKLIHKSAEKLKQTLPKFPSVLSWGQDSFPAGGGVTTGV